MIIVRMPEEMRAALYFFTPRHYKMKITEVYLSPLASKKNKQTNKKQSQGFDKKIRYTNGNWEAAKGPSRSSSRAATQIAF